MADERRAVKGDRFLRVILVALISIAIVVLASFLRLYDLDLKPFHHDEGVNARFMLKLENLGKYRYNPKSYHGPILYFLTLPAIRYLGLSDTAMRLPTAIAGSLAVALLLLLLPFGSRIVFYAALLFAISPMDVFYARSFIHETYLILFTVSVFISLSYLLIEKKGAYLYPLAVTGALSFATKETFLISFFSLGLALLLQPPLSLLLQSRSLSRTVSWIRKTPGSMWIHLRDWKWSYLFALFLFFSTIYVLFTSFFTFPYGFPRFFQAFILWFEEGQEHHEKEFLYYGGLIIRYSPVILALSLTGVFFSFLKAIRGGLLLFFWGVISFLIYSAIPYKTPWCALNFHLPLLLLAGVGMDNLIILPNILLKGAGRFLKIVLKLPILLVLLAGIYYELSISLELNFEDYDRRLENPLAYGGQTYREFMGIFPDVERVASCTGMGKGIPIAIHKKVKNPTRWYLRDYRGWEVFEEARWEEIKGGHPIVIITLFHGSSRLNRDSGNLYQYRKVPFYMHKKAAIMVEREVAKTCLKGRGYRDFYGGFKRGRRPLIPGKGRFRR